MKRLRPNNSFWIKTAGPRLRCFLGGTMAILIGIGTPAILHAQCVSRVMRVSRVQGTVFNTSGIPIPNVTVSLELQGKAVATTKTDDVGRFSIPANPGIYDLRADGNGFAPESRRIEIGSDTVRMFRPKHLWIILYVGRLSEDCGLWATTSRKQFEEVVQKPERKN